MRRSGSRRRGRTTEEDENSTRSHFNSSESARPSPFFTQREREMFDRNLYSDWSSRRDSRSHRMTILAY